MHQLFSQSLDTTRVEEKKKQKPLITVIYCRIPKSHDIPSKS